MHAYKQLLNGEYVVPNLNCYRSFYMHYSFIELAENKLYRDIYIVIEILNYLYQDRGFWP